MGVFDILKRNDSGSAEEQITQAMNPIEGIEGATATEGGYYTAGDYEAELATGSGYYLNQVKPDGGGSQAIPSKLDYHI